MTGELSELAERIAAEGFGAIGFTMYKTNALAVGWMANFMRLLSPEIKIVVGGPEVAFTDWHSLIHYQFNGGVDAAVVGEGEGSAKALFKAWQTGESPLGIPGVIMVREGKVEFSGRPAPLDVNGIPPPDFSDFDLKAYAARAIPVMFSRGCVANCSFCTEKALLWPSFQMKSGAGVLEHLDHLSREHGSRQFWATDSLLNGNHKKLEEFLDLVIAGGHQFVWGGNMRIDKRLLPLADRLKQAGCVWVTFGAESGSNSVLKAMRKGITRDDIVRVMTLVHSKGIKTNVNLIVGFPGETESDFQDTLRLVDEIGEFMGAVSTTIFTTDPHTDVGRNPGKYGILTRDDGAIVMDHSSPYFGNDWFSVSGDSTPEIRLDRLYKLRERIRALPRASILQQSSYG
jgi:radical SAM superfamily enzyme YgiQ (UPF0313 family)